MLRLHRDAVARAGYLAGRIEHVASGESTDFATGAQLLDWLAVPSPIRIPRKRDEQDRGGLARACRDDLTQAQVPEPRLDPAQGQTAEKLATDHSECGRWSQQQTGYSLQADTAAGERDRQVLDEPLPAGPDWWAIDRARAHIAQLTRLRAERQAVYLRGQWTACKPAATA